MNPSFFMNLIPNRRRRGGPAAVAQRVFCACCVLAFAGAATPLRADRPAVDPAADVMQTLRSDIGYLASDELKGRGSDSPIILKAADYLADRMKQIGLKTDLINGTPFQDVAIELGDRAGKPEDNRLVFRKSGSDAAIATATLGEGMNPLAVGAVSGDTTADVVFAGYGITAPEFQYDDYAGIDANGKVVIVLRKEPGMTDADSPFNGTATTPYATFNAKVVNAIEHGAVGLILVNDPQSIEAAVDAERSRIQGEMARLTEMRKQIKRLPESAIKLRESMLERIEQIDVGIEAMEADVDAARRGLLGVTAAGSRLRNTAGLPVVAMARDLVDPLLSAAGSGETLEQIEAAIDAKYQPKSMVLDDVTVEFRSQLRPGRQVSPNVIGVLEGAGNLADETVVVGAHYDHVGMGGFGSLAPGTIAIHNGADDNASGTAAMLSTAKCLVQRMESVSPRRRVVFIAFTGEERGLLGSKHYVRNPRFPIEDTVAMVNLDMVGRLRNEELIVYGTGSGDVMNEVLEAAGRKSEQRTGKAFDFQKIESGYGPSDQQSFYEYGVPVLFFFTGLHSEYHRPDDDSDKINYTGLTRITDTVCDAVADLVTRPERPQPIQLGRGGRAPAPTRPQVYIGVRLEAGEDSVVLSSVVPGAAADRAGIRADDRLLKIGDAKIRSVDDLVSALRKYRPGDALVFALERDGQSLETTVRLDPQP